MPKEHGTRVHCSRLVKTGADRKVSLVCPGEFKFLELHEAIVSNKVNVCKQLLNEYSFNLNEPYPLSEYLIGATKRLIEGDLRSLPLHQACRYHQPDIVETLLRNNADPNKKDHKNMSPLQTILVCWSSASHAPGRHTKGKLDILAQAIRRRPTDKHVSATKAARKIVVLLCDHGARLDEPFTDDGDGVLHVAVRTNSIECVDLLRARGACLDGRDRHGLTPLSCAARDGRLAMLRGLLERRADVGTTDRRRRTALHWLADRAPDDDSVSQSVNLLVKQQQLSVDDADEQGDTALHLASAAGNERAIRALLAAGANPDRYNRLGRTPLFLFLDRLTNKSRVHGLETLLQCSANNVATDRQRRLPALLLLQDTSFARLRKMLTYTSNNPPMLMRVCLVTIRRSIGTGNVSEQNVAQLPCCRHLKDMILNHGSVIIRSEM